MSDVLIYQTSDPRFAERAVQALQQAEIPCYRTGTGYAELHTGLNLDLSTGRSPCDRTGREVGVA
jgi:hypothetical protein